MMKYVFAVNEIKYIYLLSSVGSQTYSPVNNVLCTVIQLLKEHFHLELN